MAIALIGHIILIISSIPPVIAHPNGALAALSLAIIIMGLGTGGFKSNISPLVAEQQRYLRPFVSQTKSGERVVVNPTLTTSRIYMVSLTFFSCSRSQSDRIVFLVFLLFHQRWCNGRPDLHDIC